MNNFKTVALFFCAIAIVGFAAFQWGANKAEMDQTSTSKSSAKVTDLSREPSSAGDVTALNQIIYNAASTDKDKGQPEKIDAMIKAIRAEAAKSSSTPAAKIYAAIVTPLPLFKGIIWRLRKLVEPIDAAYIFIINDLRIFKRNAERRAGYLNNLFDYFADPNPGETITMEYTDDGKVNTITYQVPSRPWEHASEFQDFMAGTVAKVVGSQTKALNQIADQTVKSDPNTELFLYDANLLFGTTFATNSPTKRFRKFMPGHLKAMVANLHLRMGIGYYLASYNLEATSWFMNSIATKTFAAKKATFVGKNGFITNVFNLHLQSPMQVGGLIREMQNSKNPILKGFLTLRPQAKNVGQTKGYLQLSKEHFISAVEARTTAFEQMEGYDDRGNKGEYFVDPDFATSRLTITSQILRNRSKYLKAQDEFVDRLNPDPKNKFKLNLPALFNAENAEIQDLKNFYATGFFNKAEKEGSNEDTFKWNYDYGKAHTWPKPEFGGLLPGTVDGGQFNTKLVALSRDATFAPLTFWLRLFL